MLARISILALAGALSVCAAHAQSANDPPRTASGRPSLEGVWSNASLTNLTRPPGVEALVISEEQAAELVARNPWVRLAQTEAGPSNFEDDLLEDGNSDRGYNTFWIDPGQSLAVVNGEIRTSWIVDPANGQLPLRAEAVQQARDFRSERLARLYDGPENLPVQERCLIGFTGAGGPGMLNTIYNNNYQIVQTDDHLMILVEMVHDARIVPIFESRADATHRPQAITPWLGDSVAWWEGDTLVIETTNVEQQQGQTGPIYLSKEGTVTERLTRVDEDEIFYSFTVEDPQTYTTNWTAEQSLNLREQSVYEYACHEGNYAMPGILSGARSQEARGETPTAGPGIFGTPIE